MNSLELFAGCGGLAFGIAEAGFKHALVVEQSPEACATLTQNKRAGVRHLVDWSIFEGDARDVCYSELASPIELVTGGPPCQPFSIGGAHRGPGDARNMWREAIRAVRDLNPKAFLFENVRGLLRPAFTNYLEFLSLQLAWPEVTPLKGGWRPQRARLLKIKKQGATPSYHVIVHRINAADYGAPQQRHRVIVMGVRRDVADEIAVPEPTHSREALLWSQAVSGAYWTRHGFSPRTRRNLSVQDGFLLERLRETKDPPKSLPWVTVRDAISDLPRPTIDDEPIPNHRLHPGARVYPRHTGSTWDQPAKALKAGDHGVPGGENVLVVRKGQVRYFTIREMARLQGFPDDFCVAGSWKSPIKQLGNAVPVPIGRAFGVALRGMIASTTGLPRACRPVRSIAVAM